MLKVMGRGAAFFMIMSLALAGQVFAAQEAKVIRFGVSPWFSTNVNFQQNMIAPIATALKTHSGLGVDYGSTLDNIQFVRGAIDEHYDLIFVPAHVAALLVAEHGFKPVSGYRLPSDFAVYVVRKPAMAAVTLENLKGKRVGFPDEFGLTTEVALDVFQKQGLVPGGIDIRYEKYDQLVLLLFRGDVDAIVTNPLVITFLEPRMQERVHQVYLSPDANLKLTHVFLIAPRVSAETERSIRSAIAQFYQNPQVRQRAVDDTRFVLFANITERDLGPALSYTDRLRQRLKSGVALERLPAQQ